MRAQRPLLSQRYVVHLPLDVGDATPRFVGTDVSTGQTVVIAFVADELASTLAPAIGALHRHLAGLIDSIAQPIGDAFPSAGQPLPSGPVLVAELIRGHVLAEALDGGAINVDRAVAWAIRILEGLEALHRRRVPHGGLSSHAVIVDPRGRPIAPVLSQLIVPAAMPYASPERLAGAGPTISDDLWAVGLLLFEMLMGTASLRPDVTAWGRCEFDEGELSRLRAVPNGRDLESILNRALSSDRARRPESSSEFIMLLDAWERRAALPLTATRAPIRTVPSKLPSGLAAWDQLVSDISGGGKRLDATLDAAEQMRRSIMTSAQSAVSRSSRPVSNGRRKMSSIGPELAAFRARSKPRVSRWIVAVSSIVVGLGLGLYSVLYRKEPVVAGPTIPPVTSSGFAAALPSSNSERPHRSAAEERAQCIRSYFRPDTINDSAELGFVCSEEDFLAVTRRLNEDATLPLAGVPGGSNSLDGGVAGAPGGIATRTPLVVRSGATGKGWQLGWYELVATAIIRQNCCREAAPIKLPESTGWCQQLQTVVRRIAADSAKVGDISPGVRVFDEAITCLLAQGRHVVYPYKAVPTPLQKANFQQFLKHVAEMDARKAARR